VKDLAIYKGRRYVDAAFLQMTLQIKKFIVEDITFITVLKGGLYTSFNVLKNLVLPETTILGYIGVSSYKDSTSAKKNVEVTYSADLEDSILKDRNVWIIDDICDTGKTLDTVIGMIEAYHPKTIRTAVLIDKKTIREINHFPKPDVVGFECLDNPFFLGCGMGLGEKYRTLRELYEYKGKV